MQKPLREAYIVQDDQLIAPASIIAADRMENAVPDDFGQHLLNEEGQQATADDGQVEIVNHEGAIENKGLSFLHQLPAAKDDDVVCSQCSYRSGQGRPHCLPGHELELVGRISKHSRVALVEYGPDIDNKGVIERGQR